MTGIRDRSGVKSLTDTNLPSGTGAISAEDHRALVKSMADSALLFGEAEVKVIDMTTTTPPASPGDRDAYVVATGATGEWAGQDDKIAVWDASVSPSAWVFVQPVDGQSVWNLADDKEYRWDAGVSPSAWAERTVAASAQTESLIVAVSDETTALTTGTAKVTFRMPYAFTLSAVRASLTAAADGNGTVTVDLNEGGASILSTKLTIDAGEKTSTTAATAAVISDAALADDAEITIDIDDAGDDSSVSPIAASVAKGLKVTLIGTQA